MIRVLVNPDAAAFDAWWEAAEAAGDAGPAPFLRMLMGADARDARTPASGGRRGGGGGGGPVITFDDSG